MKRADPPAVRVRTHTNRRALTNVGGAVESRGEPEVCGRLAAALAIDPDDEQSRAHVHGFHSYPARMHPTLARRLVELLAPPTAVVFDPFCGSGTVLVEARLASRSAVGVDLNPLAASLAKLKTAGAGRAQGAAIVQAARQIGLEGEQRRKARAGATRRYPPADASQFEPHVLLELDSLRDGLSRSAPGFVTDALWLVLSSILTKVSRREGDTGELSATARRLASGFTLRLFFSKAEELAQRLEQYGALVPRGVPAAKVICGDARELAPVARASVDIAISSPPYPGNYDYLAQHETRLRWLSMDAGPLASAEIGARRSVAKLGPVEARGAFAADMTAVLQASAWVLRPGGRVLLVIADSVLAGKPLRTDELIVGCAKSAGFKWLATASQPRPHFHRESTSAFERASRREHVIALQKS